MNYMNKVVMITGGATGIGKAMALYFNKKGYNVIITYNTSVTKAKELEKQGIKAYKVNIKDYVEVKTTVNNIVKTYGKIDILVNNSGISEFSLFTDIIEEKFMNMIDINLTGAYRVTREVIKQSMIKNKSGSIINISSIWGVTGASCETHYSAAKAGLIGMTKALAKEVGLSNIRVNAVCPGVIHTAMIDQFTDEDIADLKNEITLNRIGMPEDVAPMVEFLASDLASYITGQVIKVDGGMCI